MSRRKNHPRGAPAGGIRHRIPGLVVLILLLGAPAAAGAQATPVPETCAVAPRSFEEIGTLIATPVPATPDRSGVLPMGEPLKPGELPMIGETVRQFIACSNAGEPLRVYALYSDAYLQRLLGADIPPMDRARYDALATPMPAPLDDRAELVLIEGGRRIADGRLGALVTIDYPATPEPKTFFFTFIPGPDSDHLLIDDILGELTFSMP